MARAPHGWEQREYRSGQKVALESPRCTSDVDELYEGVALEPEAS